MVIRVYQFWMFCFCFSLLKLHFSLLQFRYVLILYDKWFNYYIWNFNIYKWRSCVLLNIDIFSGCCTLTVVIMYGVSRQIMESVNINTVSLFDTFLPTFEMESTVNVAKLPDTKIKHQLSTTGMLRNQIPPRNTYCHDWHCQRMCVLCACACERKTFAARARHCHRIGHFQTSIIQQRQQKLLVLIS